MFLQKNFNILKEKFGDDLIETDDDQDTKWKHDWATLNTQKLSKKFKSYDHMINYQSDNDEEII
jgi:hypothetical protein